MSPLPSLDQLNQWCATHQLQIRFHGIAQHSPRLINDGLLPLDNHSRTLALELRATLKIDEWHALVDTERGNLSDVMHYRVLRYSEMLALRQQGRMPTGLAATALPFSQACNCVLLQKRSASSHLFPGFLSLLGGGFNPSCSELAQVGQSSGQDDLLGDNNNPKLTAQREVQEEAGLHLDIPENTLVTITQETDNGALQINYLGMPADFIGAHADEEEGLLVELTVPGLRQIVLMENITDLLKANLMAWLASNHSVCSNQVSEDR